MQSARGRLHDLVPLAPVSDDILSVIAHQNEYWHRVAQTARTQLRMKNYRNADVANDLHHFYLFALGSFDVTDHTFPSRALSRTLSQLLPLIPFAHRDKVALQDLSEAEIRRVEARVARHLGLATPKKRRRSSKGRR